MILLMNSWGTLGALLGDLGAVFGVFWAPHGALLGDIGGIVRRHKPIGSENAREWARQPPPLFRFRGIRRIRRRVPNRRPRLGHPRKIALRAARTPFLGHILNARAL